MGTFTYMENFLYICFTFLSTIIIIKVQIFLLVFFFVMFKYRCKFSMKLLYWVFYYTAMLKRANDTTTKTSFYCLNIINLHFERSLYLSLVLNNCFSRPSSIPKKNRFKFTLFLHKTSQYLSNEYFVFNCYIKKQLSFKVDQCKN